MEVVGDRAARVTEAMAGAVNHDVRVYALPTSQGDDGPMTLVWVDRDGLEEPLGVDAGGYYITQIAPDGQSVAS